MTWILGDQLLAVRGISWVVLGAVWLKLLLGMTFCAALGDRPAWGQVFPEAAAVLYLLGWGSRAGLAGIPLGWGWAQG